MCKDHVQNSRESGWKIWNLAFVSQFFFPRVGGACHGFNFLIFTVVFAFFPRVCVHTRNHATRAATVLYSEVGGAFCTFSAAILNTSKASTVLSAKFGGTPGAVRTALVCATGPSTVLYAEVGGTDCAVRTALVCAPIASTVSFA